jgi:hypothetical protein
VWIYYKFARVEQNCGKQRQLKQLPDEMWKRKPMFGVAEKYPVSVEPKHKVYGAADSQDVGLELSDEEAGRKFRGDVKQDGEDGLGEFYD